MRTTEAARYARWSVTVAAMLAVMVAGVYAWRAWEARQAQTEAPPPVPAAVQQRSAEFTFSKVVGNDTRFILRASRATEYKEGGRTLLEDVWITTFGGNGERSDQLHTAACEYLAPTGIVTCPGEVLIDLQGRSSGTATAASDAPGDVNSAAVHVVTSHLDFDRETGMATTDDPVQFRFPEGQGRAVGLTYDSERGELHLLREVEIVLRVAGGAETASATSMEDLMTVSSGDLFYRREERLIRLNGGATLRQGRQELHAGHMILALDADSRAQRLIARDHPVLHHPSGDADVSLSADELDVPLEREGRPAKVLASGHVVLSALRADGRHQLTAASSALDLIPESQQPRHFSATGSVAVRSTLPDGSLRRLLTSQLEVYFVAPNQNDSRIDRVTAASATMEWETSQPSSQDSETMRLQGELLDGSFDQTGELRELRGTGGAEVQKRAAGDPTLTSTSRELLARMAPGGQWSTIDQTGEVRLKNAGGDARGDRARFDRAADSLTLTGSVVLTDASSQTRAQTATFRQAAGELRAEGNVSTMELAGPGADAPTHISSSRMITDTDAGRAVYSGKARMWQGDSVIQADTIELDRSGRTLIATGDVNAVFPQARQATTPGQPAAATASAGPFQPSFWRAEAGRMVYQEDQHRARLEQAAQARSTEGSMRADRIDLFFAPEGAVAPTKVPSGLGSSLGGQKVQQAQGLGAVRVESAGRVGTSERADYSAAESKFILSGGHPTLIDKFGNSTAGRQLTFFFADDRIVVDSEEGSRTLTLHRVEK